MNEEFFSQAVANGIDQTFIQAADQFGRDISRRVTTSQIRSIFGSVKKMEMGGEADMATLLLLKPRIAYAASRNRSLDTLKTVLTRAIDAVDKAQDKEQRQERFRRFCQGFEAILAYHRAYGGK